MLKKLLLLILLFSTTSDAQPGVKVLESAFQPHDYNYCLMLLRMCPKEGRYINQQCMKKQLNHDQKCNQLRKISAYVEQDPQFMRISAVGGISIVSVKYLADGKKAYVAITASGRAFWLIPKTAVLAHLFNIKDNKKVSFLPVTNSIKFGLTKDKKLQVVVALKVHKDCMACAVIGNVKSTYLFSTQGHFLSAQYKKY